MMPSASAGPWSSFVAHLSTAGWLANLAGTMVGVMIGGLIALWIMRRQLASSRREFARQADSDRKALETQLKQDRELFAQQAENDRDLFRQMLAAQRDTERRERRRAAAVELGTRLKPAADRLSSFEGLDVRQDDWPDYQPCRRAVKDLEVLLYVNGLLDLVWYAGEVLSDCEVVWQMARRAIETCIAENPDRYDPEDPRIRGSMIQAELMTGRKELATLVTTLLGWDGDETPVFPDTLTVEELNNVAPGVRKTMIRPLGPTEQAQRLRRLRDRESITQDEFDQQMAELTRQTQESDEKYVAAEAAARRTGAAAEPDRSADR